MIKAKVGDDEIKDGDDSPNPPSIKESSKRIPRKHKALKISTQAIPCATSEELKKEETPPVSALLKNLKNVTQGTLSPGVASVGGL